MRIQFLNGGLANQVFQYIFTRYAELSHPGGEPWLLDDSFFFTNHVHNGYELDRVFGLKPRLLSRMFDEDVWEAFIGNKKRGISVPQTFKDFGTDLVMYSEVDNYSGLNPFDGKVIMKYSTSGFHPEVLAYPYPDMYYHGYWLNKNWFASYQSILREELTFPAIKKPSARAYADRITSELSVGVHVRRGDFVKLGWTIPVDHYMRAMRALTEKVKGVTLFVFSDDLEWCQEHEREMGFHLARRVVYVSGNRREDSYIDLQLMTMCKGLIVSKSSFSYLGAVLASDLKICINLTDREL